MTSEAFVRLSEARMEGVGKRYGRDWAVQDVSISVRPGELYTLLGPPGAGKTTLLRMLAGLTVPDAGRILIDDEPVDLLPPSKRNIGMVFPRGALWPHMSVFDNIAFGLEARGNGRTDVARKVQTTLARLEIEGLEARRPSELSASQQSRVALARALVMEPRLLLLDDPLSGLDAAEAARMRLWLLHFQRDVGTTTIYATRDHAEALALSTRIAVVSGGRMAQEGKPADVYWRPRSRFVAEFVGAANLLAVRVVELREVGVVVETAGGARLPVAAGGRAWTVGERALLCLRPEALAVEEAALARFGIPGTVAAQSFEGARQLYEVDIGGDALRVEMATSPLHPGGFKPGDQVKVEVAPETSVLLLDEVSRVP